jgi:ATP-dependent DNA helicase RecG
MMPELNIIGVIASDKVQKSKPLNKDEYRALKAKRMIEGRRPNLYVPGKVAAPIETRAEYIKRRAFDKNHYKNMLVEYLEKFTKASRAEFDQLLMNKISDALDSSKKKNFITNLL